MSKQAGLRLSFFWSVWFCWKLWAFRLPCNPASPGAGVGGLLLLLVQPCLALPTFIGVSSPFTLRSSFFFLLDFSPPCTSLPCFHLFCSFGFSIDASPKLSCSGHIRVVTSVPLNILALFCVRCTWGLILKFSLGWGDCYCSAHFPFTVFVSMAIYTV